MQREGQEFYLNKSSLRKRFCFSERDMKVLCTSSLEERSRAILERAEKLASLSIVSLNVSKVLSQFYPQTHWPNLIFHLFKNTSQLSNSTPLPLYGDIANGAILKCSPKVSLLIKIKNQRALIFDFSGKKCIQNTDRSEVYEIQEVMTRKCYALKISNDALKEASKLRKVSKRLKINAQDPPVLAAEIPAYDFKEATEMMVGTLYGIKKRRDLQRIIRKDTPLTMRINYSIQVWRFLNVLLDGLFHHGDIKPENILFKNNDLFLADWTFANSIEKAHVIFGTHGYLPDKQLLNKLLKSKSQSDRHIAYYYHDLYATLKTIFYILKYPFSFPSPYVPEVEEFIKKGTEARPSNYAEYRLLKDELDRLWNIIQEKGWLKLPPSSVNITDKNLDPRK